MKFKNLEEQQKALDLIETEPPAGVDVEAFSAEVEAKINEIMAADIEEDYEPEKEEDDKLTDQDEDLDKKKAEEKDDDLDPEIKKLKDQNEFLKNRNSEIEDNFNSEINSLKAQIEKLSKESKEPTEEEKRKASELDTQISNLETEVQNLTNEISSESDDPDEEFKKLKKLTIAQNKLNNLNRQKYQSDLKSYQNQLKELSENQSKIVSKKSEDDETKQFDKMIKSFTSSSEYKEDFQSKRTYSEMDDDYARFATKVAQVRYGTKTITPQQVEKAMGEYTYGKTKSAEHLRSMVEDYGIEKPEDLEEFMVLSEVKALTEDGLFFDRKTCNWKELKNSFGKKVSFPDFDTAYEYIIKANGIDIQKSLDKDRNNQSALLHTISRKRGAVELDQKHQRRTDLDELSAEDAQNILNSVDEESIFIKMRENFNDPDVVKYNKALEKAGYQPITMSDI